MQLKKSNINNKMSRAKIAPDIFVLPNTTYKKLPKFAVQILKILETEFPKTYVVGGAVRNILLNQKVKDVDVATSAKPEQIVKLLKAHKIKFDDANKKFGIIIAKAAKAEPVEIATFRSETYGKSRFPKVNFIPDAKRDSRRRDFTVNALYYSLTSNEVLDFTNGLEDVLNRRLRFINRVKQSITEDPLRIVRAFRFALQYNLQIDPQSEKVLHENKILLKKINSQRIKREINCCATQKIKLQLQKVIHNMS